LFYNFFSAPRLSVNVKTEEAVYRLHGGKLTVNGTFITEVHLVALVGGPSTGVNGMGSGGERVPVKKWLNASYWASELNAANWGWRVVNGTCGGRWFKLGKGGFRSCEDFGITVDMASASFTSADWQVSVSGNHVFDRISGPRHRLDLGFRAMAEDTAARLLPHGIVGQSFATPTWREGMVDIYPASGSFTTTAMAEGAIDGVAKDYEMATAHSTRYTFSRFEAVQQARIEDGMDDVTRTGAASAYSRGDAAR